MSKEQNIFKRFESKFNIDSLTNCWIWNATRGVSKKHRKATSDYGSFWYNSDRIQAHRMSYLLYKGEIPNGLFVLHKCDNTLCVNPDHLFLGTRIDNFVDMIKKDRSLFGEKNHQCKLSEKQVLEIFSSNLGCRKLGKIYNVSKTNIQRIKSGFTWSKITGAKNTRKRKCASLLMEF